MRQLFIVYTYTLNEWIPAVHNKFHSSIGLNQCLWRGWIRFLVWNDWFLSFFRHWDTGSFVKEKDDISNNSESIWQRIYLQSYLSIIRFGLFDKWKEHYRRKFSNVSFVPSLFCWRNCICILFFRTFFWKTGVSISTPRQLLLIKLQSNMVRNGTLCAYCIEQDHSPCW